jgi:hypothetical protein
MLGARKNKTPGRVWGRDILAIIETNHPVSIGKALTQAGNSFF